MQMQDRAGAQRTRGPGSLGDRRAWGAALGAQPGVGQVEVAGAEPFERDRSELADSELDVAAIAGTVVTESSSFAVEVDEPGFEILGDGRPIRIADATLLDLALHLGGKARASV